MEEKSWMEYWTGFIEPLDEIFFLEYHTTKICEEEDFLYGLTFTQRCFRVLASVPELPLQ